MCLNCLFILWANLGLIPQLTARPLSPCHHNPHMTHTGSEDFVEHTHEGYIYTQVHTKGHTHVNTHKEGHARGGTYLRRGIIVEGHIHGGTFSRRDILTEKHIHGGTYPTKEQRYGGTSTLREHNTSGRNIHVKEQQYKHTNGG